VVDPGEKIDGGRLIDTPPIHGFDNNLFSSPKKR
jgi:hypothetical protein